MASRYGQSIIDLDLLKGDIAARGATAMGNARAREAEALGSIWGRAINQFGQIPGQVLDQMQQQRRQGMQDTLAQQQIAERQGVLDQRSRANADQDAIDRAFSPAAALGPGGAGPMPADAPPPTRDQILANVPGHLRGKVQETFAEADKMAEQSRQARLKADESAADYMGFLGTQIRGAHYDPTIANLALQHAADAHADDPAALRQIAQMRAAFASDPSAIQRVTDAAIGASKYKDVLKPVEYTLKPGETRFNQGNQPIATVPPTPKEPTPKAYQHVDKLLDGKPTTLLIDPSPGGLVYDLSGKPVENAATRVKPIPPASMQVLNSMGDGSKVSATAQMIADYKIPPPSPRTLATPAGEMLMTQVKTANPDYDATQYPTRQKMRQAFTSGPQSQTINSLNTAIGHLDQFVDVAKALDNGNFQPGNQAYNWLKATFGDSAPTNFEGIRSIMAGELASAFKKSGATDQEIASVEKAISSKNSTQQLTDYVTKIALPALGSKVVSFDQQYRQVMGANDPFKIVLPESAAILTKHGIDPAHPTMGSTGAPSGPTGMIEAYDAQGNIHHAPAGTPLPAGWKLKR